MSFLQTWDETSPSDTQAASLGALDIRNLTTAVRERMAIDHYLLAAEGADPNIGYHKSATLIDQVNDLLGVTGAMRIYGKTISGKVEFFLVMADNTVVQITKGGLLNAASLTNLANILGAAGIIPPANIPLRYSSAVTYAQGDIVTSGSVIYYSLQNANLNNDPATQPTWWSSKLPAIDGSLLTNIIALTLSTTTGAAPIYAARAWVNFNGTGTVAIRASGNVSSITDNGGNGKYRVNFTSAMTDANFSAVATCTGDGGVIPDTVTPFNASYVDLHFFHAGVGDEDPTIVSVVVFR